MSVLSYADGDLFVIRTIKYLSTNPSNKWANSYEFKASAAGSESDLLGLGTVLINFEKLITRATVLFDRILISTWGPDSTPYNPETFISSTVTAVGSVATSGQDLGLNQCMTVTRMASSGRFGHLFYRGYLAEADVQAPAGVTVLTDRAGQQGVLDGAISGGGLDDYIGSAASGPLKLVLISKNGSQVRLVNQLRVQGVSTIPTDHAWFNRTTP
jgi:hypothetical protein